MTGRVLDVAWLCPCGQLVPAGEKAYRWGARWRCIWCYELPPQQRPSRLSASSRARTRAEVTPRPGMPRIANREKPHVRYATGATLEELLRE